MTLSKSTLGIDNYNAHDTTLTDDQAISQFREALKTRGLIPPESMVMGSIQRCATSGKRDSNRDGAYLLHLGKFPAGGFQNHSDGLGWENWRANIGRKLTKAEERENRDLIETAKKQHIEAENDRRRKAQQRAQRIWNESTDCESHPYLSRKGVTAYGTRLHRGLLLIPARDSDDILHTLQFIPSEKDNKKIFLKDGRKTGCYFMIGKVGHVICVVEGFATGASIHQATSHAVAVGFDAGNLKSVVNTLRKKYLTHEIVICGDDDYDKEGNPGRQKAQEAALSIGAKVVYPVFKNERPANATDFNDLHQAEGIESVTSIISSALDTAAMVLDETESNDTQDDRTVIEDASILDTQSTFNSNSLDDEGSPFPDVNDRPQYVVLDDWTPFNGKNAKPGVYYCYLTEAKKDSPSLPVNVWICSPLHVDAMTFDSQSNNWGRLLRFKNSLGKWREWAMPMELLRGSGEELRGELLAMGVLIDLKNRQAFSNYLFSKYPERKITCALQVGWSGDSFVLPDVVIGQSASKVIFQSGERGVDEHTQSGTLNGWKESIAAQAVGNPLLILALSSAFAAPLLARCNAEGGGIHFVGDSSTGKTTVIEAACSVWGGQNYRRSWRATANGMEGAAALFNDLLLALDEISECDPKEVGAIIYALTNGKGKQRASRSGSARGITRWRCFVISSGERTIATAMLEGGHRAKAGQSVRLLDIPVARKYGVWDHLRDFVSASGFSDSIKSATNKHHGIVGREFLQKLTHDERDFCEYLDKFKQLPIFVFDGEEGQDKRAAARFALIGMAGELATEYGLTSWSEGNAIAAAAEGFKLWRSMRGKGNDERRQISERISDFISRHGDSRFSSTHPSDLQVRDRAGYWRDTHFGREYLFNSAGINEAIKGFDLKRALDTLQDIGALAIPTSSNGKRQSQIKVNGVNTKLYVIDPNKLLENSNVA